MSNAITIGLHADAIATHPPGGRPLSREEATELTAQARTRHDELRMLLLRIYEGAGHVALGYTNFGEYCEAEFGMSPRAAYLKLQAAKIADALASASEKLITELPPMSDAAIREFADVVDDPSEAQAALSAAMERARLDGDGNARVTADDARAAVEATQVKPDPRDGNDHEKPAADPARRRKPRRRNDGRREERECESDPYAAPPLTALAAAQALRDATHRSFDDARYAFGFSERLKHEMVTPECVAALLDAVRGLLDLVREREQGAA
ncbi:MAG: hypothetical protein HY749_20335 [Gammaproteobacteria bacterium]|nr:hypothetical protein [Gammaproteobacteria bacterium]